MAGLAARALRRPTRWAGALLFHALAAALDGGPCADLEGYPLLPHCLLEEHVNRLCGADTELREEPRRVAPRLPLHAYGDVDRLHADLPVMCAPCGDCTRGRRYVPGIRHGVTDIRHVATGIRLDPLPYTKIAPMMQCAMGAIYTVIQVYCT